MWKFWKSQSANLKVLEKVKYHRFKLINLVQSIYDQEEINKCFLNEWYTIFFDKLHDFQKPELAVEQLKIFAERNLESG